MRHIQFPKRWMNVATIALAHRWKSNEVERRADRMGIDGSWHHCEITVESLPDSTSKPRKSNSAMVLGFDSKEINHPRLPHGQVSQVLNLFRSSMTDFF
jgi:hypothetical protein